MRKANVAVRFDTASARRGRIISSPHCRFHGALPVRKDMPAKWWQSGTQKLAKASQNVSKMVPKSIS